jgi:hypothetical protein
VIQYDVKVGGVYRMLYRTWEVPVSFGYLDTPSVEFVGMEPPPGTIGYVKDHAGNIWTSDQPPGTSGEGSALAGLQYLAEDNEAGFANPSYFPAGTYTVRYTFRVHPPIEYDARLQHLNLLLADSHVPYRSVTLVVPANGVTGIYPYPPSLSVSREGDAYIITGKAGKDEGLGFEILATRGSLDRIRGFPNMVDNVQRRTEEASLFYGLQYTAGKVLLALGALLALGVPLFLYLVWRRYGRE